jgi:hypothetical protein
MKEKEIQVGKGEKKFTSIFWIARGGLDARKEHQPCGV